MRGGLKIFIVLILFLFLGLSFVSADGFGDFLNKITGKVTQTCTDSDRGLNYFIYGTTTDSLGTVSDGCSTLNDNVLTEYYCSENSKSHVNYICPNGCSNGACVQTTNQTNPTCMETDGGINYNVKGNITYVYGYLSTIPNDKAFVQDYCSNSTQLQEVYCLIDSSGMINFGWTGMKCPNGCSNGACIGEVENNNFCTDSDGGLNYFIYGTTTDSLGTVSDGCSTLNDNVLTEYYCSENSKSHVNYICPNGCSNGACITEEYRDVNNPPYLLIFISPQYSNEDLIIEAVNKYQISLKNEGFSSKVIKLNNSENTISQIRKIILTEVKKNNSVKAGLFIGEDIFSSVTNLANIEAPQYNLFEILDEPINYIAVPINFTSQILPDSQTFQPSDDASIFDDMIARGDKIFFVVDNSKLVFPSPDFFVSSLMPPESYSFNQKIEKIIFALNKFAVYHNNPVDYGNTIEYKVYNFSFDNVAGSTPLITLSSFSALGDLQGEITGLGSDCLFNKSDTYKLVLAWGHGDPSCVYLSRTVCSENISSLKTPFIIVSGCSTGGWYTNESFGGKNTYI